MHHANNPYNSGKQSIYNSSTTVLTAGSTFLGAWEDITNYGSISVLCIADVSGTLYAQFSIDGLQIDRDIQLSDGTTIDMGIHSLIPIASYFRVKVVNGGVNQASFRLQTIYNEHARIAQPTARLAQTISDYSDVLNCRSVIVAQNQNGVYNNVQADLNGALKISDGITVANGESLTLTYNPVAQNSYFMGITDNPQQIQQFITSGGTVSPGTDGNNIDISIDNTVGAYAIQRGKRVLKYRYGLANLIRMSAKFTAGVANSLQFIGVGNAQSDLYFAMSGTQFGVRRSYGGLLHKVRLTMSAAASGVESLTITLNSVAFNISVSNAGGAISFTAHQIEIGGTGATVYTGWNLEHFGNTITFIADSVGARGGTYSFVNNTGGGTAAGTFTTLKTGANLTTEFVAQADWNGPSPMKNTLDPVNYYNLYEIEYSWHGISNILFKVYNPDVGKYEVVHTMKFANTSAIYSLTSPNMYPQFGVASLGSSTPLTLFESGFFTSILGNVDIKSFPNSSISNSRTLSAGVEAVALVITNRLQVNGYSNQSEIFLNNISLASDGNRAVLVKCIKNPTTLSADTTANYTNTQYVDENYSLVGYDTTSLTYTGGTELFRFIIGKADTLFADLFNNKYYLARDDVIIFTALSAQTNTFDISCTLINDIT